MYVEEESDNIKDEIEGIQLFYSYVCMILNFYIMFLWFNLCWMLMPTSMFGCIDTTVAIFFVGYSLIAGSLDVSYII